MTEERNLEATSLPKTKAVMAQLGTRLAQVENIRGRICQAVIFNHI
jgi:hypothetical protein